MLTRCVNPLTIKGKDPTSNRNAPPSVKTTDVTARNIAILLFVVSLRLLNQSAIDVKTPTAFSITGISAVPMAIITPSNADPNSVNDPRSEEHTSELQSRGHLV